jgi:hypothetical protein
MINMKRSLTIGIIMVLLLACIGVASANLVSNGGFEKPEITGDFVTCPGGNCPAGLIPDWTIGGNVNLIRTYWTNAEKYQSIDLTGEPDSTTPQGSRGSLSQQIPTATEGPYVLTFDMSGNFVCGPDTKRLEVYWDGNQISGSPFTFEKSVTWSQTNMEWSPKSISLQNPSTHLTELKFVDTSADVTNCGVALDNIGITVSSTPVPEFPTMALPVALIVGMLGAILFIQKTKDN